MAAMAVSLPNLTEDTNVSLDQYSITVVSKSSLLNRDSTSPSQIGPRAAPLDEPRCQTGWRIMKRIASGWGYLCPSCDVMIRPQSPPNAA
jgi:hypothetical protein